MNKKLFFHSLRKYVPMGIEENNELWRFLAIELVKKNCYKFPADLYREMLKYLYRARSKFDWEFKRKFGYYLPNNVVLGVDKLIVKEGMPINFL